MTNSLWTQTARLPEFSTLQGAVKTEVLIIGGGIAGLLCAHALTEAGVDCIVAEADRICGGITKDTTAKITAQHGLIYHKLVKTLGAEKAWLYLDANTAALDRYRTLCRQIPCGFESKDSFVYASQEQVLHKELEALRQLEFPGQFASQIPIPVEHAGAVRFADQAQFHPLQFLSHIAEGLNIFENTRILEIRDGTAITDHARIRAEQIIVATHFPFLNKHGMYFLKQYQQRSYVLALEQAQDVQGMYIGAEKNSLSFRNHNGLLLLGGGGHRTGKTGGNWAELKRFAQLHYPGTRAAYLWATQDCMTLDGMPYIGRYSKHTPDLYVATGFNKWGMTGAMVSAMLLRDLVMGRHNPWEDLFSPSRSILRPQLLINGLEASGNLLRFGHKRCPHMGCALRWNPQEHSWDCPCHGSRFTSGGKLIDNPATGDLKEPPSAP